MSKKSVNWVSKISSSIQDLRLVSERLRDIADALRQVGNGQLASRLIFLANSIHSDATQIDHGMTEELSASIKRSGEATANILSAVMAGIKITKQEK